MACAACAGQRAAVTQNLREGNVTGTFRAVTLGARMMAEKMVGIDINAKYGTPADNSVQSQGAPAPTVYTRT
jgi:hypothetical protein